jgi:hypothetical protein
MKKLKYNLKITIIVDFLNMDHKIGKTHILIYKKKHTKK